MKKSEFTKQIREEILSSLAEKKKLKKDEKADIDDFSEETNIETPEEEVGSNVDPKITKIQKSLKSAYDSAKEMGDEKLTTQLANTITYFTRAHVVNKEQA